MEIDALGFGYRVPRHNCAKLECASTIQSTSAKKDCWLMNDNLAKEEGRERLSTLKSLPHTTDSMPKSMVQRAGYHIVFIGNAS